MKPSFEVSPDVRKLVEFLLPRNQATYREMNRVVGRALDQRDRYVLYSALRRLQRDHGLVFVAERAVGIVRATNGQKATLSTDHVIRKASKAIRRGEKIDVLVNTQDLDENERLSFYVGRSQRQCIRLATTKKMRNKIAAEITDRGGEAVDVTEVIALFRKRSH